MTWSVITWLKGYKDVNSANSGRQLWAWNEDGTSQNIWRTKNGKACLCACAHVCMCVMDYLFMHHMEMFSKRSKQKVVLRWHGVTIYFAKHQAIWTFRRPSKRRSRSGKKKKWRCLHQNTNIVQQWGWVRKKQKNVDGWCRRGSTEKELRWQVWRHARGNGQLMRWNTNVNIGPQCGQPLR